MFEVTPVEVRSHVPPAPQSASTLQPPAGFGLVPRGSKHECSKTFDTTKAGDAESSRANASSRMESSRSVMLRELEIVKSHARYRSFCAMLGLALARVEKMLSMC